MDAWSHDGRGWRTNCKGGSVTTVASTGRFGGVLVGVAKAGTLIGTRTRAVAASSVEDALVDTGLGGETGR